MDRTNLNLLMENQIRAIPFGEPLLLHACCGPCSSAVLERLAAHFSVTLLYYNPNIWPEEEYRHRRDEAKRLVLQLPTRCPVVFEELPYEPTAFSEMAKGLEQQPEGGARCKACFALRLEQAAALTEKRGIHWFTTTLSVSPRKNAALLYKLGSEAAQRHGVAYLPADFKKKDGYKRSVALSEEYNLYRQEYCGCEYSYRQRQQEQAAKQF